MNVLVTSISKKVSCLKAIRKALSKVSPEGLIFGADTDENCIGRFFVDHFWKMPLLNQLTPEAMLAYCQSYSIRAIIPTRDGELAWFAKHRNFFRLNEIHIMISSAEAVESCIDKLKFYELLKAQQINAIPTYKDLDAQSTNLKWVVKSRTGAGSKHMGLNLSLEAAIEHGKKIEDVIYQPFISGKEYSVDLYVALDQKVKGVVVRSRDSVVNGESVITTTHTDPEIEGLCANAAQKLGLYGHVIFQVIETKKERLREIYFIECNCRFGGASSLSIAAGLDSFYWFFLESLGNKIDQVTFNKSGKNLKQIRYPEDLLVEV